MGGANSGNDFDLSMPFNERLKFTNNQVFITVMFESAQAFKNIDEIASIDGIDAITLGYQDLAQDLGVLGSDDQDRIIDEKRHQILKASKKYGKTCSMLVNSIEQAEKWKKEGVLLLNFSSDVSVLMEGYKSAIEKITK